MAALGAGLNWRADAATQSPASWFPATPSMDALLSAAVEGAARREAVGATRNQRCTAGIVTVAVPGSSGPPGVSKETWSLVPPSLRPVVMVHAGRLYLRGHPPDQAVEHGLVLALRERRHRAAIASALPETPAHVVSATARHHAAHTEAYSVDVARAALRATASDAAGPTPEEMAAAELLAARLADPPYPAAYQQECLRCLALALRRPSDRSPLTTVDTARADGYRIRYG